MPLRGSDLRVSGDATAGGDGPEGGGEGPLMRMSEMMIARSGGSHFAARNVAKAARAAAGIRRPGEEREGGAGIGARSSSSSSSSAKDPKCIFCVKSNGWMRHADAQGPQRPLPSEPCCGCRSRVEIESICPPPVSNQVNICGVQEYKLPARGFGFVAKVRNVTPPQAVFMEVAVTPVPGGEMTEVLPHPNDRAYYTNFETLLRSVGFWNGGVLLLRWCNKGPGPAFFDTRQMILKILAPISLSPCPGPPTLIFRALIPGNQYNVCMPPYIACANVSMYGSVVSPSTETFKPKPSRIMNRAQTTQQTTQNQEIKVKHDESHQEVTLPYNGPFAGLQSFDADFVEISGGHTNFNGKVTRVVSCNPVPDGNFRGISAIIPDATQGCIDETFTLVDPNGDEILGIPLTGATGQTAIFGGRG